MLLLFFFPSGLTSQHKVLTGCSYSESGFHVEIKSNQYRILLRIQIVFFPASLWMIYYNLHSSFAKYLTLFFDTVPSARMTMEIVRVFLFSIFYLFEVTSLRIFQYFFFISQSSCNPVLLHRWSYIHLLPYLSQLHSPGLYCSIYLDIKIP